MAKGNPNPRHGRRLTPEERAKGPKAAGAKRRQMALERIAFEQAFAEAAQDLLNIDAYELRKRLVAKVCAEALKGKQWAMEKCLVYLFGYPKQDITMRVAAEPPTLVPDIPEDMREELRRLRERVRELRGQVIGSNGHTE